MDNDPSMEDQVQEQMVEVGQSGTHMVVEYSTYLYNTKEEHKTKINMPAFFNIIFVSPFKTFKQLNVIIYSFLYKLSQYLYCLLG